MATETTTTVYNHEVPNKGKRWSLLEENRMMGLIDANISVELIARMLGRSPTAVENRAARFAAKDFLKSCAVSPDPFFVCAPVEMEKILKKYPISERALRSALTTTPTEDILFLLKIMPDSYESPAHVRPVDMLVKLGILRPWAPKPEESRPAEQVDSSTSLVEGTFSESVPDSNPVETSSSEVTPEPSTTESTISDEKLRVMESNIKTEIEFNVARVEALLLEMTEKPPVDEVLTRVSSLESTASDRFDNLEDRHSQVVSRLVALETTPEHIAAIDKKVTTIDAKLDKLLHFFGLDKE